MLPGAPDGRSAIVALLGPTNTGKTHRAVERMLEHDSGMIGLPLRLLAREVFDRVTARIGEENVALLTGEEKRIGARPRYWICTVEAMPIDHEVDFVAIDEVQLAAHAERGHVFTERLLRGRGRRETWFLGSDTMRPLVEQLVPTAKIQSHPRLSQLRSAGVTTLGALPPRSAVVAFSAPRVYELAERLRARRGGAAVVLGALSPRARNAQVAMYQAGEVDFMVATDAIGMGLNLDVAHVAFAELRKFDGREVRPLDPAELGQIAGRAGRYLADGTFGMLAPEPPLPPPLARSLELGDFAPQRRVFFRNHDLDTSSVDALVASLRRPPPLRCLRPVERALDFEALLALASRSEIGARARGSEAVSLLWQVCQIPDFRRLMIEDHVDLLSQIYLQLSGPRRRLDPDWMRQRIERIDDVVGDIDTLLARMSFIRTWTYVAYQSEWIDDAPAWQALTRGIEDRLSDALHERLVQRFVDRSRNGRGAPRARGATLGKGRDRPSRGEMDRASAAEAAAAGPFARLRELRDALARGGRPPARTPGSIEPIVEARHEDFRVTADGRIHLGEAAIGALCRGRGPLEPQIVATLEPSVGAGAESRVRRRLLAFARDYVSAALGPLRRPDHASLSPAARGLLYQLEQAFGTIFVRDAAAQIAHLTNGDREALARSGIRIGARLVYAPALLKPHAIAERAVLLSIWLGARGRVPLPPAGAVSLRTDGRIERRTYLALGYAPLGARAVRADVADELGRRLDAASVEREKEGFTLDRRLCGLAGCSARELPALVQALGFRRIGPATFAPATAAEPSDADEQEARADYACAAGGAAKRSG